jgi:transposase
MSRLELEHWQRHRLRQQLRAAPDARLYRRTLAVLELDRGRSPTDVAEMLGVTRQSVHNWAAAIARDPDPSTLADEQRSGRPPVLIARTESALRSLMPRSPRDLGYPDADWTVPLLQQELTRNTGLQPSDETVRRGLHRLGYVWRRSRYVLDADPGHEEETPPSPRDPGTAPKGRDGRGGDRPADAPAAGGRPDVRGGPQGGP